jgi:dTDP-glucose 4,6-dehydratase
VYNIGAGNERTNREITDLLLGLLGKDESSVDYVEDRLGHDRRYSIATDKVTGLGWSPATSFEDGLAQTVGFYTDRREWWEPLLARVKNR